MNKNMPDFAHQIWCTFFCESKFTDSIASKTFFKTSSQNEINRCWRCGKLFVDPGNTLRVKDNQISLKSISQPPIIREKPGGFTVVAKLNKHKRAGILDGIPALLIYVC